MSRIEDLPQKLCAQSVFIRNEDRPPPHHYEPFAMQPSQIARYQLPHGAEPDCEFFVILVQQDTDPCFRPNTSFARETQEMRNQPTPYGGEGKLFNQVPLVPQSMSEHA